jgi:hypothetical protein
MVVTVVKEGKNCRGLRCGIWIYIYMPHDDQVSYLLGDGLSAVVKVTPSGIVERGQRRLCRVVSGLQ